jgi:ADP-heptose:LPS heptosyltransferase
LARRQTPSTLSESLPTSPKPRPTLLVVDFWGIGDLALATAFLRKAVTQFDVTLLAKPHSQNFLQPSFPQIRFIPVLAPWTAFRGKYLVWKWPWRSLLPTWWKLFKLQFNVAVSVRNDPRDHVLMWSILAQKRLGFGTKGSSVFLTHPVTRSAQLQHKIADWNDIAHKLGLPSEPKGPWLDASAYHSPSIDQALAAARPPIFAIHAGASALVRRWPESYFCELIVRLRHTFNFTLVVVPDPDGYGQNLKAQSDIFLPQLQLSELVNLLGRTDLLLCNDSGPGHISACCNRACITFFGPAEPVQFQPWGDNNLVVVRDLCEWRPCRDYCRFAEPKCMTSLTIDLVWPEIEQHIRQLIASGILPRETLKS